jgi:hypothetical protein
MHTFIYKILFTFRVVRKEITQVNLEYFAYNTYFLITGGIKNLQSQIY